MTLEAQRTERVDSATAVEEEDDDDDDDEVMNSCNRPGNLQTRRRRRPRDR